MADEKPETRKPKLKLIGIDNNAFVLLAAARKVALKNGMDWNAISGEAMSGDYKHLLATLMEHFDVH
jgi:hypothetical protein